MAKTTRIVCLCILGAVGTLCGVSTINAPVTEDKIEMITPTEPLRSAYIVADIAMQDLVAISLQGELYALERRTLAEYNGDNSLFSSRADVLRLDEDMQSRRQPVTTYDIAAGVEALRAAAYDDDTLWSVVYDKCSLTATTYFDCDWDNPLSFSIAE